MFGKTKINNPIYYPLLASEEINGGNQPSAERTAVWARFDSIASEQKDILITEEIAEKLVEFQKSFHVDDAGIEGVSILLRWFVLSEIDQTQFSKGLQEVCGEQTQKALQFVQKEILTIKPKPKTEEVSEDEKRAPAVRVRLPLLQALSKYENLGNQLISQERIRIKSQSEPVRPSLLYWVKYYRDELGIGHHDSVQRGNFLFRSENGKRLSAEERERVNLVLKSVEENFPLEIDTERQEILFPVFVSAPVPRAPLPVSRPVPPVDDRETRESVAEKFQPRANPAFSFGQGGMAAGVTPRPLVPETSGGALSFSSKHVFPAEKRSETVEATPAPVASQAPVPQANPFRIRPVSLGKEE